MRRHIAGEVWDKIDAMLRAGNSIPEVSRASGVSKSAVQRRRITIGIEPRSHAVVLTGKANRSSSSWGTANRSSKTESTGNGEPPQDRFDIEVIVKVNGQEFSLRDFVTMTNKFAAIRDAVKHLGLGDQ